MRFSSLALDMVAEARPGDGDAAPASESEWSPRTPWGDAAIAKKAVIEKHELPLGGHFFFSRSLVDRGQDGLRAAAKARWRQGLGRTVG